MDVYLEGPDLTSCPPAGVSISRANYTQVSLQFLLLSHSDAFMFSVHMVTLTTVFMSARQSLCPPPVSLALLAEGARLCDNRAVPRVSVIMWLERERKDMSSDVMTEFSK